MKEIILKVLYRFGCGENGQGCQVNLQSLAAQEMIAVALEEELNTHVQQLIEDIVTPTDRSLYPSSPRPTK